LGQAAAHTNLSELAIAYRSIDTLSANPHNARTHSKHQIRQIADSLKAFGFTNPVLIDSQSTIVAGHGRVEAAKLLGLALVPTILLENLSKDQIRAYVLDWPKTLAGTNRSSQSNCSTC
jgi:ParB-like chromosome segregation protein Spo0J